jgi:plastocyanin
MIDTMKLRRVAAALLTLGLIAVLAFAAACGGDDDDGGDDDETATATATPADTGHNGNGGEETFDVTMTDNAFDPEGFTVPAGAHVTFNLTNDGAAIHNMRIAGEDGDYNTDDDAVSDPDLVSGGETATLEWTAPDEAGEIDFQCDLHPTDMLGVITVE